MPIQPNNPAGNPDLVDHLHAIDVADLSEIGGRSKFEEIGTQVFIDQSQPYNILSLHQAQEHGFCEMTSRNKQHKILTNPERGI